MEKKKDEAKRSERSNVDGDISGSVTGGIVIGGGEGAIKGDRDISIDTGGGSYVGGNVETGGGDFVGRDMYSYGGPSVDEIKSYFERIYSAIKAKSELDELDKFDLEHEVKELQEEVGKGDFADERFLSRRLRTIQRIDPDILDVVLGTLTNPAAGFSAVVRETAERMRTAST